MSHHEVVLKKIIAANDRRCTKCEKPDHNKWSCKKYNVELQTQSIVGHNELVSQILVWNWNDINLIKIILIQVVACIEWSLQI